MVACRLILIGCRLIAVRRILITIGANLVVTGSSPIALRACVAEIPSRPNVFGTVVVGDHRDPLSWSCIRPFRSKRYQ
jgi:hypothetical protein